MQVKTLGRTGLKFPPIIFGTSALGNLFRAYPKAEKKAILREIFRQTAPHTVFDTAGKYGAGLALEVLGEFLAESDISRDQVIITNKLGWMRVALKSPEPTFEPGVWKGLRHDAVQQISEKGILQCFEKDNALLQGYRPQLVSLHDPDEFLAAASDEQERADRWQQVKAAFTALSRLKEQGKVKGIGVGAKDWTVIRKIYAEVPLPLDYVMLANSLTIISHPPDLLDFVAMLRSHQVGIINAAIFQSGFLVGEDHFDYKKIDSKSPEGQKKYEWREQFFGTCKRHDIAPFHACIQFALSVPGVCSLALSISKPDLIRKNLQAAEEKIPKAFWEELKDKSLISRLAFI
ncbi:D-threo-aldose 1-dehydrogenase [Cyclobacterium lianum]|uniref:D-threo-aldose 1-dehydrogenase n=1 Tax=Cyclobacterium lianum TaxID=388280 RepID=A0A1M7QG37_9BACT|nr:aldo/keto reductase [Cyclobacterium lianum]SHN29629.1 D-threo-aldose 1-dehydrogenase [Cyclobacterium lianum]